MAAQTVDLNWLGGDSESHTFRYLDSENVPVGVATGIMQLRTKLADTLVVIEKDAIIDNITGEVSFDFTNIETGGLVTELKPSASFVYDTQIVTNDGRTVTLTKGRVSVDLTVTRPF